MQGKVYGTRGDLQRTAKFIAAAGLPVLSSKANEQKKKKDKSSWLKAEVLKQYSDRLRLQRRSL